VVFCALVPYSLEGGWRLSREYAASFFRVEIQRLRKWLSYTSRLKEKWSLRPTEYDDK
jgi:hypothetical protein